jgi:hypothetical protein
MNLPKIEKGIPMPNRNDIQLNKEFRAIFSKMEIGDSLLLPKEMKYETPYRCAKRLNIKIETRATNHGRRAWRTA